MKKNKNKETNQIKKAKSIKGRYKRLAYIYDTSCSIIDELNEDDNICGFKCNQCIMQQKNKSKEINGCCRTCRYQSQKGCKSSNLTCKLFYCDEVKSKYKVYSFDDIKLLNLLSWRQRLILKYDFFSSREEVLLDLYFASLILSGFRLIYSCYKNSFYLLFKNRSKNYYGKIIVVMTLFYTLMSLIMMPQFLLIVFGVGFLEDIILRIINSSK